MAKVRISAFARRYSFKQEKQMEKSWKPGKYPYRKKCIKMTYKTFASVRTASRWRQKGGGTLRATASQCSDSQPAQHTTPHHLPIAVPAQHKPKPKTNPWPIASDPIREQYPLAGRTSAAHWQHADVMCLSLPGCPAVWSCPCAGCS